MNCNVEVDLTNIVKPYKPKVIVFFNHSYLVNKYTEEYLEENKLFAVCFNTTQRSQMHLIRNYQDVIDKYQNSNRVLGTQFYIGLYDKVYFELTITNILKSLFGDYFDVVDREEVYTYETEN